MDDAETERGIVGTRHDRGVRSVAKPTLRGITKTLQNSSLHCCEDCVSHNMEARRFAWRF